MRAAEGFDRLFVSATFKRPWLVERAIATVDPEAHDRAGERYREAAAAGRLFAAPPVPAPGEKHVRTRARGDLEIVDLAWTSAYTAIDEGYRALVDAHPLAATVHARMFRHGAPAPAVIAIHGWGGGFLPRETLRFRARWFHKLGLDVVIFHLPFHGRRGGGFGMPPFPSTDPVRTNEGLAQAISDLRGLVAWLRARGAPSVAVFGMSLGGLTTSLLATVDGSLELVVPMIPVASLPEVMWDHGAGGPVGHLVERGGMTRARFVAAFEATTPLARPPKVPPQRVLVVEGDRDRVIPAGHAERLRAHFGPGPMVRFPGAHLLQVGRSTAFEAIETQLRTLGILGDRQA